MENLDQPRRPKSVTFLVLSVLIITLFFWTRFYQAIRISSFILSLSPSVSPGYLILTGLVFGTAGLHAMWGLWFGKRWAAAAARRFFAALAVYYWLDFFFFVVSDTSRGSWPFAAFLTVLSLVLVFRILSGPGVRAFLIK